MGRPREQEIGLTEAERRELEGLARSASAPHGPVRRARIVLASADRRPNTEIARELGLSAPTVAHWRRRFLELGLAGLYDEHRPGRPRTRGGENDDEKGAGPLAEVPRERPARGTRRTVRTPEALAGRAEALERYERELGEAGARWSGAGTGERRRAAARDALMAAWQLSHDLGLTTAAKPLLALAAGLDDLGKGRAPDWMRPTNVGGTSILGRSEKRLRAVAVDTLEQLSARGLRPAEAAEKVAGAINAGRGPSGARRAVTARTVLKWRERRASLTGDEPIWRGEVSARMQAEASPELSIEALLELMRGVAATG